MYICIHTFSPFLRRCIQFVNHFDSRRLDRDGVWSFFRRSKRRGVDRKEAATIDVAADARGVIAADEEGVIPADDEGVIAADEEGVIAADEEGEVDVVP